MTEPVLPLLPGDRSRPVLWRDGRPVPGGCFLAQATALAQRLPAAPNLLNLCGDRGHFLVAFAAALIAGRTTLLPPARTPTVLAEIAAAWAPAAVLDDVLVAAALADAGALQPHTGSAPVPDPDRVVVIGFTSGSTGVPRANAKTWRGFCGSTARNQLALAGFLDVPAQVLATVPSQHMYGMETCVLLPLLGHAAIACAQPLFPQDLAEALARLPGPRVLVTTPVHLRAFVEAGIDYPAVALIVSATAPLAPELARAAEQAFAAPLLELFGSTETCVIGQRRTATTLDWTAYPGLDLQPSAQGTWVHAPYLPGPVLLHDHLELASDGRFGVRGRCQDMLEIAGKRASLGDITARLLAVPGVLDAAVLQCAGAGCAGIERLVAFVVAPGVADVNIQQALRDSLDPVFLPRRLCRLDRLPRSETGKLSRDQLLALLDP